jgi:DNA-binding beta-propeller fold protein YncE
VLLVGNKSAHTLWALDLASGEQRASFETGIGPHEVEVSPDRRFAVVSNYGERSEAGNSLTVIDWPAGEIARVIDLGEDTRPHGMAFLPDGRIAVTTEGSDRLLVVDIANGEVLQRIAVGGGVAHMVAASPDGRVAWVTNISAGTLEKVDLEAGRVVGTLQTGAGVPRRVWTAPDRRNRAKTGSPLVDSPSREEPRDSPQRKPRRRRHSELEGCNFGVMLLSEA